LQRKKQKLRTYGFGALHLIICRPHCDRLLDKKFVTLNQIYGLFPQFLHRMLKQIFIISFQILLTEQ